MKILNASAILLLLFSANINATLIGDVVSSTHVFNNNNYGIDSVVVTADNSEIMNGHNNNNYYTIDVNASNIFINHTAPGWNSSLGYHGFTIFDLNDSSGFDLSFISVDTNISNWSADRLVFNHDQIWIQLTGDNFTRLGAGYIDLELTFGNISEVSEPSIFALIGLGLLGLGVARKRQSA